MENGEVVDMSLCAHIKVRDVAKVFDAMEAGNSKQVFPRLSIAPHRPKLCAVWLTKGNYPSCEFHLDFRSVCNLKTTEHACRSFVVVSSMDQGGRAGGGGCCGSVAFGDQTRVGVGGYLALNCYGMKPPWLFSRSSHIVPQSSQIP